MSRSLASTLCGNVQTRKAAWLKFSSLPLIESQRFGGDEAPRGPPQVLLLYPPRISSPTPEKSQTCKRARMELFRDMQVIRHLRTSECVGGTDYVPVFTASS